MQLVGRFTRTNRSKKLGKATIIANIVADDISEQFTDLYAVDADWNLLLGTLSKEKVEKEFLVLLLMVNIIMKYYVSYSLLIHFI